MAELEEKSTKEPKFFKVKFRDLEEQIQKKFISEIVFRSFLLLVSLLLLFFIDKELALFIISFALIYLLLSVYSLSIFLTDKAYFMDAKFLGIWEGETKVAKIKKKFWTKFMKKQDIICLEAAEEHYLITVNKVPPLIIGDTVRVYAVPEAIFKGNDGVYRVSGVLHLYKITNS